jgi:hypothetical protein
VDGIEATGYAGLPVAAHYARTSVPALLSTCQLAALAVNRLRSREPHRQARLDDGSAAGLSPNVSNQLSNNRPRRRHTPVDVSGPYAAAHEQNAKARALDNVP